MNMKRGIFICTLVLLVLISLNTVKAENNCVLSATLVNQDPYPALSGGYVEVLFQINGVGSACEDGAATDLVLEYPFSLDDGVSERTIKSSTYAGPDGNSNWNVLYKLRIDPNAIEDDYEVELRFKEGETLNWDTYSFKKFNITVEDAQTDFEVHIQDYNIAQRNLVFEILNTGNQDIEALTVEIPKQDNILVKGSNRNIVGDLDSNEYTSADFEAIPVQGDIKLNIYYTDSINERRMVEKTVYYDPSYFLDSLENQSSSNTGLYVTLLVIILLAVYFFYRRHKKNKKKNGRKKFTI